MGLISLLPLLSLFARRGLKPHSRRRTSTAQSVQVDALESRVLLSAASARIATVEAKPASNGPLPLFGGTWFVDSVVDGTAIFTQNGNIVTSIVQGEDGLFPGVGKIKGNGKLLFKITTAEFGIPVRAKLTLTLDDINAISGNLKVKVPNLGKINAPLTGTRAP